MEKKSLNIRLLANDTELDDYTSKVIKSICASGFQLAKKTKIFKSRNLQPESRIYLSFIEVKTRDKT